MSLLGRHLDRRTLLSTAAGGLAAAGAAPGLSAAAVPPGFTRRRIGLTSGVQSGDVTTRDAVLWARADRPGRLVARVTSGSRSWTLRGPRAGESTDLTAKLALDHLAPGREYHATLGFEDERGLVGEQAPLTFRTASTGPAATSFVWTGDTCGQGWGINPDLGGLVGYRAMLETRPDFFVHAGDTIYADGPLAEEVTEPDGQVWRNLVIPEVTKVAETLSGVPRAAPLHAARRQRPGAVRRGAGGGPVGRPRDHQQLVSG